MTDQETAAVKAAAQDILDDVDMAKKLVTAYKATGKAGVMSLAPEIITLAKREIDDVRAVIPVAKAGWKTSEFWLVPLILVANGIYFKQTGSVLPDGLNAALAGLGAVYTFARTLIKKPAPNAPPSVTATATAT